MAKDNVGSAGDKKCVIERDKFPAKEDDAADPENCRCKEVAGKTPREMLGLMLKDLAFWKKQKSKAYPGKR